MGLVPTTKTTHYGNYENLWVGVENWRTITNGFKFFFVLGVVF